MESVIRNLAVDIFFPYFCLRCNTEGSLCCTSCLEAHVLTPPKTACPFCESEGFLSTCLSCKEVTYLDGLIALGTYADPLVQGVLKRWKYHGDPAASEIVSRFLTASSAKISRFATDAVTFVPLHPSRRNARGFDQAEKIAESIARVLGVPATPLLRRKVRNAQQAKLKSRVVGDLDKLFVAAKTVPESVLLCDDVFTSGATMDAAAKALKEAGAREVWGFVLAKGNP